VTTRPKAPRSRTALWRQHAFEAITSSIVAGQVPGPDAPAEWAPHLGRLIGASRAPVEGPSWWTPTNAYRGGVETRVDPQAYHKDGMHRLGPRDLPVAIFQLTLAGWGHFELYGKSRQRLPPGRAFFAIVPSRHRYYLPRESPGWTFAWVGIYHPHLVRRIARKVAITGPVIRIPPSNLLVTSTMRLVRGAFEKDFRDRYEVELALFEFVLAYERLADEPRYPAGERERLLEWLRARALATPRRPATVDDVAAERGMTRSHFSHYFRARTGLTPARFMTELRVQEAARMLLATRAPLKQVASEWGFANVNHFGKAFRRFQHASPAAYRRSFGP
jgi:AraC-like DNA-binding protein